jgi:hypothetical protein
MTETIVHKSPWPSWYASQDVTRGVSLHDKSSDKRVVVEPPAEWGRHWAWNITEDGKGIYFKRNGDQMAKSPACA